MDTTTVRINGRCNASCSFCELDDGFKFTQSRFDEAIRMLVTHSEQGARHLRIGGGEPLLERRLPGLIQEARKRGYETVTVETNGTIASLPGYAQTLADAGMTQVMWSINSPDASRNEATYRLEGSHASSLAGIEALSKANIPIIARTPLSKDNLEDIQALPEWLKTHVPNLEAWWLRPLAYNAASQYPHDQLPALDELRASLSDAIFAAKQAQIDVFIEDAVGLPYCLFSQAPAVLRSLQMHPHRDFSRTHIKRPECGTCAVAGDCPGQPIGYEKVHGPYTVKPYRRYPAALSARASRPETHVIYDETRHSQGVLSGPQVTIRVLMPCNQACTFCFVNRTSPSLSEEAIHEAIDKAAEDNASRISFSGGEPTLHPELHSFIAKATALDIPERELQTNALLLANPDMARALAHAGLTQAVVSLHAVEVTRYQAITKSGTPEEVITGVRNLLDRGIRVELNVVHNQVNAGHLVDIVNTVAARIPEVEILFSVTFIVEGLPRAWSDVALRYRTAVPELVQAMRTARNHGSHFRMTGRCGTPPCVWKGFLDDLPIDQLSRVPADRVEASQEYFSFCQGCAARSSCYGVNKAYLARFGQEEFSAIDPLEWQEALARSDRKHRRLSTGRPSKAAPSKNMKV